MDGLQNASQGVYLRAAAGCPIIFGARLSGHSDQQACDAVQNEVLDRLSDSYPGVSMIIIARLPLYALGDNSFGRINRDGEPWVYFSMPLKSVTPGSLDDFGRHYVASVCRLNESHPVYVMRPLPEFSLPVPQMMGRANLLGKDAQVSISRSEYDGRASFIWRIQDRAAQQCGVKILDPTPYLCDESRCFGNLGGNALFYDTDHMGRHGVKLLTPMFRQIFDGN